MKYLLRIKSHLTLGLCQLALQVLILELPGLQVLLVGKPLLVSFILKGSNGCIPGSNRMLVATLDTIQLSLVGPGHLQRATRQSFFMMFLELVKFTPAIQNTIW